MRQWFLASFSGALIVLTLVNSWFHHTTLDEYQHQFEAAEHQIRAVKKDFQTAQLEIARLKNQRTDALDVRWHDTAAKGEAERVRLAEQLGGVQVRLEACEAELEEIAAERDSCRAALHPADGGAAAGGAAADGSGPLLGTVASCPERLAFAARQLRRLGRLAAERGEQAEASHARMAAAGEVLVSRWRHIYVTLKSRLKDKRTRVLFNMYADKIMQLTADMGLVLSRGGRQEILKELHKELENRMEALEASQSTAEDPEHGPRPLLHSQRTADPELAQAVDVAKSGTKADVWEDAGALQRGQAAAGLGTDVGDDDKPGMGATPARPGTSNTSCVASVAAVVPFRGRGEHLAKFYEHMVGFLQSPEAARLCWTFFIVEQFDTHLFNRGWLFNVGLTMSKILPKDFKCITIQDLDTLPEVGAGVDYASCEIPTQLSSEIECYGWVPPYAANAGGVVVMSREHWAVVNGFSNAYEGWGGEDDDLRLRMGHAGLLKGTCGSWCNMSNLQFRPGQVDLITRPEKGKGRFICLDEKGHTSRRHGDMEAMQSVLNEMRSGNSRWAYDGLSNLHFDLLRHEAGPFPGAPAHVAAELHWVSAVPSEGQRFTPSRLRLVLAPEVCSQACRERSGCTVVPTELPFTFAELRRSFTKLLGSCLLDHTAESLGFWLINRRMLVKPIAPSARSGGGSPAAEAEGDAAASWVLTEAIRTELSAAGEGAAALVIRAVPRAALELTEAAMRSDPARQQMPLVAACAGLFLLEDPRLGSKHTVNVGSEDCEQRSWTHLQSFGVLSQPRTSDDEVVCVGEAVDTWTMRIARQEDCSGMDAGRNWTHKFRFYLGKDGAGPLMCVRHINEEGRLDHLKDWSRWQVVGVLNGRCIPLMSELKPGQNFHADKKRRERLLQKQGRPEPGVDPQDGFALDFVFPSMADEYEPTWVPLCVEGGAPFGSRQSYTLGCDGKHPLNAVSVLQLDSRSAGLLESPAADNKASGQDGSGDQVLCIGFSEANERHRIFAGRSCSIADNVTETEYKHVAAFLVPHFASGHSWCIAECEHGVQEVRVREPCESKKCKQLFGGREVLLEDLSENLGVLSAAGL